jgi:hypothetical protein
MNIKKQSTASRYLLCFGIEADATSIGIPEFVISVRCRA